MNIDTELWRPREEVNQWNPMRYDFYWNEDYTMFQLRPLKWWDDASYAQYQARDCADKYYDDLPF